MQPKLENNNSSNLELGWRRVEKMIIQPLLDYKDLERTYLYMWVRTSPTQVRLDQLTYKEKRNLIESNSNTT